MTSTVTRALALITALAVTRLSVGQDDHSHQFHQIISGVGERLKTAGYQDHELTSKVLNLKPNDTTFYYRYLQLFQFSLTSFLLDSFLFLLLLLLVCEIATNPSGENTHTHTHTLFHNVTRHRGYSWRTSRSCECRRDGVNFRRFVLEEKNGFLDASKGPFFKNTNRQKDTNRTLTQNLPTTAVHICDRL